MHRLKLLFFIAVIFLFFVIPKSHSQNLVRIASNTQFWTGNYKIGEADSERQMLSYLNDLGYTHVTYLPVMVNSDGSSLFQNTSSNGWVYNSGNYTGEFVATEFVKMKEMIEDNGMEMIPVIECLTHCIQYIERDSSISEFYDPVTNTSTWDDFCGGDADGDGFCDNMPGIRDTPLSDHVAFVGNYDGTAFAEPNVGLDCFVREFMRIIQANWGNTTIGGTEPDFIIMGHDEIGYNEVCFVKPNDINGQPSTFGRSNSFTTTSRSTLIAQEINQRVQQFNSIWGTNTTRFILWADSFLPSDYGEPYQLAGNLENGTGGVLQILRDTHNLQNRIVLIPWVYAKHDGFLDDFRGLYLNKVNQLRYIDELGYDYIPGTGEQGAPNSDMVLDHAQCTYEWVRASMLYPNHLIGYTNLNFAPYTIFDNTSNSWINNCDGDICVGFTAPLLAYLAWTYPTQNITTRNVYSAKIMKNIDYINSRITRTWIENTHYSEPSLTGALQNSNF